MVPTRHPTPTPPPPPSVYLSEVYLRLNSGRGKVRSPLSEILHQTQEVDGKIRRGGGGWVGGGGGGGAGGMIGRGNKTKQNKKSGVWSMG